MSFSMSPPPPQPPQKPTPAPYPPQAYQNSASPPNDSSFAPPPAKRQRLSPDPRSPQNGTPTNANSPHGLSSYGNPYAPKHAVQSPYSPAAYASLSPQSSFNMPQPHATQQMSWPSHPQQQQPYQQHRQMQSSPPPPHPTNSSNMMPPPPRPNKEDKDEKIDVEDIGDSLFGSGINLKDEENYLHSTWNNRHAANESFATNQSTSFGSSTASQNNSFNLLTQASSFGSQGPDGAFSGTLGQPLSQESIEAEVQRKREAASRNKADFEQHHLNNPFLLANCLRNRMHRRAYENGVKLEVNGMFVRHPEPRTQVMMNGTGTEGVVAVDATPDYIIDAGVPFEQILSLVSLATGERLRGLTDDAYGLARARQYGDHGRVVPPEFAEIAMGEGKRSSENVIPESVTRSQWDKVPEPESAEGKGEVQEVETPQPVLTVSFQGTLNARLRELAERDQEAEKERIKRREARRRRQENSTTGDDTTPADTPADAPSTPAEAAAPVKVSKKEQSKKAKESSIQNTEAQLFNQSNQTAAMMALGKKGNRYKWMSGGVSNIPTNRFAKPGPKPDDSPAGTVTTAMPAKDAKDTKPTEKTPTWGDWREDAGIQLRDWVMVLERDGREKRALQKAMNQLQ